MITRALCTAYDSAGEGCATNNILSVGEEPRVAASYEILRRSPQDDMKRLAVKTRNGDIATEKKSR